MMKFSYLAVLAFIFFGTVWLEIILNARVYRKIKRLILTIVPVVILMVIWDYYAMFIPYYGVQFSPMFLYLSLVFFTSKMALCIADCVACNILISSAVSCKKP